MKYKRVKNYLGVSRIVFFFVCVLFWFLFHIKFFWVIALWYAIIFVLEKVTRLKYTLRFETILLVFILLSSYIGSSFGFYDRFWWWDKMLHFIFWFCFAFIGYSIIVSILKEKGVKNQLFVTVAFSFCFAVCFGAIWEIIEYFYDKIWLALYWPVVWSPLVQTSPWLNQIDDTMQDIIIETVSAAVLNTMLYIYYRFWIFTFFHTFSLTIKEEKRKLRHKIREELKEIREKLKDKVE